MTDHIGPSTKLFVWDRATDTVAGPFEPDGPAAVLIRDDVWRGHKGTCRFAAQIRFRIPRGGVRVARTDPFRHRNGGPLNETQTAAVEGLLQREGRPLSLQSYA